MQSPLIRKWGLWVALCLVIYALLTVFPQTLTRLVKEGKLSEVNGYLIYFSIYVASATFSCIAFLTTFRAIIQSPKERWDSLSGNAYLIYLVHWAFVTWCQFALLSADLHAFVKFLITFFVAVSGSWLVSIVIRRNAFFAKHL